MKTRIGLVLASAVTMLAACRDDAPTIDAGAVTGNAWQLLASELPSALLSVSGRSASDIFAVGADKGHGPLVLHFDGTKWNELKTGQRVDLWWVHAFANGPALMSGSRGTVLRYDGQKFERMNTPGLGKHTVYGHSFSFFNPNK